MLKCPTQVQDLMVFSFRKAKSATVRDKTLLFQTRDLTFPVQILHPSKARFNSPPPGHGQWAKACGLLWGGCWSFELIDVLFNVFFWCWLSLRNTTLSLSFGTYTRLMLKISRILQKLHQDHLQDEGKLNIEIKCK